jgi:lysozyme
MNDYNITQTGIDLIKYYEGFVPKTYICPAGKPTIGYGHVVLPGEKFTTLDESAAEKLLIQDLQKVQLCIKTNVEIPLTQNQFDALCAFIYNIGTTAFINSTLLKMLNAGDPDASDQFLRWCKAKNKDGQYVVLPGLQKRRQSEKDLFDK